MEGFLDRAIETSRRRLWKSARRAARCVSGRSDGPSVIVRARRSAAGGVWMAIEDVSELRRLQQIRAEFIDNLSHELRTPLTTVSLLAETLTREADAAGDTIPAKMRDRIGKIEVETGHLVQMVNELLDLSRIETGGRPGPFRRPARPRAAGDDVHRAPPPVRRSTGRGPCCRGRPSGVPLVRGDEARLGQVLREPAPQRREVQPGRWRRDRARPARPTARSSRRWRTTASASRRRPRRASSSVSTRWTVPASGARPAGPASVWRSRVTSSSNTADGSGCSPRTVADRPSRSRCPSPTPTTDHSDDRRTTRGTDGPIARGDLQHPQPGRPLARASAADPRGHGGPPAGSAGAPGGRLRHAAGPPHRRGRGGALRGGPGLGGSPGVRQQPVGQGAAGRHRGGAAGASGSDDRRIAGWWRCPAARGCSWW